jgi:fructosamine-3-kinase
MLPLHPEQPPQIYDGYQSVSPPARLPRAPTGVSALHADEPCHFFGGEHLVNAQRALERVLAA